VNSSDDNKTTNVKTKIQSKTRDKSIKTKIRIACIKHQTINKLNCFLKSIAWMTGRECRMLECIVATSPKIPIWGR